ncbi:MAG: glycosyltransferase family 2 protein [Patescibacteria group bacterium]|nr:glycosyltransferase family 2 protein [Patescibacteria group bacterium]
MENPLISVIIPAHNNGATIRVAVDSIRGQTYRNLEIIIVDDNSTDDTSEVVRALESEDPRVRYFKLEDNDTDRIDTSLGRNVNAGYSARNHGFTKAQGGFITFQDGDDASLKNRIEIQYRLLSEYNASHITTGWLPFSDELLNTQGDVQVREPKLGPDKLYTLSQETKGLVAKVAPRLNALIPFRYKRLRVINKLFFGSLAPYPGAGNSPLFRREVIEKVRFRKLRDRVWPSFMGRGADRDFNFQVAETFRKSYMFPIPLYMWRVIKQNSRYEGKELEFLK